MKAPILFSPEARAEMDAAFLWYEKQQKGAGVEFVSAVDETLTRIEEHPMLFPLVDDDVRRAAVHRFPYGIYYSVENERVTVVAVFHAKRNPQSWQDRTKPAE